MTSSTFVLHIDDDAHNNEMVAYAFQQAGDCLVVHGAPTINKAISMLKNEAYDAVLIALMVPHEEGHPVTDCLEGLNRIRAVDPHIPIIVLTDNSGDAHRCIEAGACGFLMYNDLNYTSMLQSLVLAFESKLSTQQIARETSGLELLRAETATIRLRGRIVALKALQALENEALHA